MAKKISDFIGNTPLVKLSQGNIFAKLEYFNPSGSIKDRTALFLVKSAQKKGILRPGSTIVEPTSGNTGIALAWLAKFFGFKAVLVMPENVSKARVAILKKLGAKIVFVKSEGMKAACEKAKFLSRRFGYYLPDQFANSANPKAHIITGREIWRQMEKKVDIVVAGIGTGGTISGIAKFLKQKNPQVKIVGVEPKCAPALYSWKYNLRLKAKPHKIEGIGAGFVPKIVKKDLIDEIKLVSYQEARAGMRQLIEEEAIWGGISSGAVFFAAKSLSRQKKNHKKNIVFIVADSFLRYLES